MFRPAVIDVVPDASFWTFYKYCQWSFVNSTIVFDYPPSLATPNLFFMVANANAQQFSMTNCSREY